MPVWHERTRDLVADGRLRVAGIVQEQHPDRARLFMQWHAMDWPIMVDAGNELGVRVVPITVLIDEAGIVRTVNPRSMDEIEAFLALPPVEAPPAAVVHERPDAPAVLAPAADTAPRTRAEARLAAGDHAIRWDGDLDLAIAAYTALLDAARDDAGEGDAAAVPESDLGPIAFRLGVALRRRADATGGEPADFAAAIAAWKTALDADPNQYIWRRRIQQYGPRLDKPYRFYDWVHEAREAIVARGETPSPLRVEPRGAELAAPQRSARGNRGGGDAGTGGADDAAARAAAPPEHPDPDGRVLRDTDGWVRARTVLVPDTQGRPVARVHVVLEPDRAQDVYWNNEVEPVELWIDAPAGVRVDPSRVVGTPVAEPETTESRTLEFELTLEPRAAANGAPITVRIAIFYYVCEGIDGTCVYRRRDLTLELPIEFRARAAASDDAERSGGSGRRRGASRR